MIVTCNQNQPEGDYRIRLIYH